MLAFSPDGALFSSLGEVLQVVRSVLTISTIE